MKYKPTIGLEIHAELKTQTKMFCDSRNDPDETRPNVNICPICMAHPGTLPVINKEAVRHVLKIGIAVGGELADYTEFDRKNYFYPDIPKGYQISQYKHPLVRGGELSGVVLTRVHLEEDTAKSFHKDDHSLIDCNRAGVPLMELVTEPVIHDAATAVIFAKELQLLLRTLGASEANLEKGEMRVEANVSVAEGDKRGTKVEVKNLNSFKAVEGAITYEIARQSEVLDRGERVVQETRGWDEDKVETFSQRIKEESADYRYFPDPDLPKLKLSEIPEFSREVLSKQLPELPHEKRLRYKKEFEMKDESVEFFLQNQIFGKLFEEIAKMLGDREAIKLAANYIVSDLRGLVERETEELIELAGDFSELIRMTKGGEISSRGAKDILAILVEHGGDPRAIAKKMNMIQKSDEGELRGIVERIISTNPTIVEDFKKGKESGLQFLVGQGMKESKGSANPQVLAKLFKEILSR